MTDSHDEQDVLVNEELAPPNQQPLYIVLTKYEGPHPTIEGVFINQEEAEELMDDCRATVGGPYPLAWSLWRVQAEEGAECLSP